MLRAFVSKLWGKPVESLRMDMSIKQVVIHMGSFCTQFVRNLWVKISASTQLMRPNSAQLFSSTESVDSIVMPITHSPYYYVCSDSFKKLINNKECA